MKKEEINRLLERYYNGESSEYEEIVLRTYFAGEDIPEEFAEEKNIFGYYSSNVEVPEPSAGFESSIISAVDRSSEKVGRRQGFISLHIRPLIVIAAGFLLLTGSYFFFNSRNDSEDTFIDPQLAYNETMKILREVSVKMNKGMSAMEPVGQMNDITSKHLKVIGKSTGNAGRQIQNIKLLKPAFDLSTKRDDN
jgi:hypothetical protein